MNPDYSLLSDDEFDDLVKELCTQRGISWMLSVGDTNAIFGEELNNEVLDLWVSRNPDKAFPNQPEESDL